MTYKDLFDAQHEYCTTEDYPGTAIRPHAFIAGVKWLVNRLYKLPLNEAIYEIAEMQKVLQDEEVLTKWTLKVMSPFVPNKCESCDRFDECFVSGEGRLRELCQMYGANVVFKRKEQWEHQKETDDLM